MEFLRAGDTVERGRTKIRVKKAAFDVPVDRNTNSLERHEASHTVVQDDQNEAVYKVTTNGGPGYAGYMAGPFNAIAAAAPIALGLPGVGDEDTPGSDVYQIRKAGYSVDACAAAARAICDRKRDHIDAIATGLKNHKTLHTADVGHIITAIDRGPKVEIEIETPQGTTRTMRRVNRGQNVVPVELGLGQ